MDEDEWIERLLREVEEREAEPWREDELPDAGGDWE
jgi:hypothetical protein